MTKRSLFPRHRLLRAVRAALVLAILLSNAFTPTPVEAQGQRLVLAFYYAWFDENTWTPDKVPDMPVEPYRSADPATIARHVREAKSAGIDALVQSWYGPGTNQTESNFAMLLDEAQKQGLRATVDFEVTSPFMPDLASLIAGLEHLRDTHAQHPAFLRYGNKPVVFFWRQQHLSAAQWVDLRNRVDPNRDMIWLAEGYLPEFLPVFDGLHLYSITWAVNTDPWYTASKMRKLVDEYKAENGGERYWVATTMPGYDDTHIAGRAGTFRYPRSPEYYRTTWEAAIDSSPEMIIVTSFNEWREGTMIEPSVTYGNTYLDLTRELAATYKGVAVPTPAAPTAPAPTPTTAPTETNTPEPTATPTVPPTATPSPTPTDTVVPTSTPVPPTSTATPAVPTPTATPAAPVAPTAATAQASPVAAATPSATPTDPAPTPTPQGEGTPTATSTYTVSETSTPSAARTPPTARTPPCLGASLLPIALTGCLAAWWRRQDKGK
jgi:hypothetical protein